MENNKVKRDGLKGSKELALQYMTTLVEVARESFLILDSDLRVVLANPTFYQNFQVSPMQTENILLYELGNGQWNISDLRKLLEEILPQEKVVKDYEVKHTFETIGKKTILLNARQIDIDTIQMIVLAMEDITVRKELEEKLAITAKKLAATAVEKEDARSKLAVTAEGLAATAVEKEDVRRELAITAEKLATYTKGLEVKGVERTAELADRVKELETLNKSMVGRELKMIELKKELKILQTKIRKTE